MEKISQILIVSHNKAFVFHIQIKIANIISMNLNKYYNLLLSLKNILSFLEKVFDTNSKYCCRNLKLNL